MTRAYSFASAPHAGNRFELCLNRVPDGKFSVRLFSMKPGEVIDMRPPLGTFTLRQPPMADPADRADETPGTPAG